MSEIKAVLMSATRKVLVPLIRILLRHGISHAEFIEMAKQSYFEAADRYFTIPKRKQTYSRIAVLTGLSRKEVMRIAEGVVVDIDKAKGSRNRADLVIQGWVVDPDYNDEEGNPLVLELTGDSPSFAALVERRSGDITARAILDELIRINAVEKIDKTHVRLLQIGYLPGAESPDTYEIWTTHVGDLLSTIAHNLSSDQEGRLLQKQLTFHEIPESVFKEFKQETRQKSEALLKELNKWLAEKKANTVAQPGEKKGRLGLGIYCIENE